MAAISLAPIGLFMLTIVDESFHAKRDFYEAGSSKRAWIVVTALFAFFYARLFDRALPNSSASEGSQYRGPSNSVTQLSSSPMGDSPVGDCCRRPAEQNPQLLAQSPMKGDITVTSGLRHQSERNCIEPSPRVIVQR